MSNDFWGKPINADFLLWGNKDFYCTLLSAPLIKLTSIKNWKKYTIYWLQNFLTVKNLV
jgi:hypothetical protein